MTDAGSRFAVTFFLDHAAQKREEETFTASALADLIRSTSAPEKARLPWLKLARFGNARTEKGSLRHDRNVIACSGIEADYDGEKIAFAEAVEILEKAGIEATVYTSPSHTDETGSGKSLADPGHCDHAKPYVHDTRFGARKVEADALVARREAGRELCRQAILRCVPRSAQPDYQVRLKAVREQLRGAIAGQIAESRAS